MIKCFFVYKVRIPVGALCQNFRINRGIATLEIANMVFSDNENQFHPLSSHLKG